ncbi:hypothetical protein Hanom_Chr00s166339g01826981 [Helianthus anomalus]
MTIRNKNKGDIVSHVGIVHSIPTCSSGNGIRALDMKVEFAVSTGIEEAGSLDSTGIAVKGIRGVGGVRNQSEGMRRV